MRQVLAALLFFTRLPIGRWCDVPAAYFKRVVPYWPLTGWLTAGISVGVLFASSYVFPAGISLLLAILTRLLLTGCLHEDGLADFCDGFGGGLSRDRILAIMKDSHTGVYGVIGLIVYFGLLYLTLSALPVTLIGCIWLAGEPYAKGVAAMVINRLPYARREEESKTGSSYQPMDTWEWVICACCGLLPLGWLPSPVYLAAAVCPCVAWWLLTRLMKRKIQGYTGDCCGALFLLCELSFYLGVVALHQQC